MKLLFFFFFTFLKNGTNPLWIASCEGHVEVVQELLKGKVNIDASTAVGYLFLFCFNL